MRGFSRDSTLIVVDIDMSRNIRLHLSGNGLIEIGTDL